ncbi:hypothetical protein [Pseudomonas sp.]|jgi:hypothetical protein|uniref:hypothetical protein n=1 Tax=Pseudomonas sp. TaxID=306 RepID=UPI002E3253AC|nr:hypothetical protein [Pseudomonas sp.]HEX4550427.1 hypothetical protein [Pseudomonas sp.]
MSYCINVSHLEKETIATVEIFGPSEEFKSVRISQFQCIGWLLGIFDTVRRQVPADGLSNPEYEQEALERVGKLSPKQAAELLALNSLNERFAFVWDAIGYEEQEIAKAMDCRYFDNFWPSFDAYSQLWSTCSHTA